MAKIRTAYKKKLRKKLLKKHGGVCGICKEPILVGQKVTLDHIIPTSKGGTNLQTNLQPAHVVCNIRKGNLCPEPEPLNPPL